MANVKPKRKVVAVARNLESYKTYRFKDKDPMIDKLRTAFQGSQMKLSEVCAKSGLTTTTPYNWFYKGTRRPQFASMCAFARAIGYDLELVKKE